MAATGQGRPAAVRVDREVALPAVASEYHQFYRTAHFRWWRPLVALVMLVPVWFAINAVLIPAGLAIAGELDVEALRQDRLDVNTPTVYLLNNLSIIVAIPLAWAAHRVVFGQQVRWLSSVEGRFRWNAFWPFVGLSALAIGLPALIPTLLNAVRGVPLALKILPETWFLLAVVLLTTPLQAAAEEIALRGMATRALGSWFRSRGVGLLVATALTVVAFMLFHGAGDPWLNVYYLAAGLCASMLVWRTGGLEGAIALHVVNNLFAGMFLPFIGTSGVFDRQAGAADASTLVGVAGLLGATALSLRSRTAPAAATGEASTP